MKRISTIFLLIGIGMFIYGAGFFLYAITHPTFSFTIRLSDFSFTMPLGITYAIYLFYFLLNIGFFVAFGVLRHKENKKK